jgi:hypothetical protein
VYSLGLLGAKIPVAFFEHALKTEIFITRQVRSKYFVQAE